MTAAIGTTPLSRVRPSWTVVSVAASRLLLSAAAIAGASSSVAGTNEGVGGVGPTWLRAWTSYDANWYIAIARSGYEQAPTTAFFPVMPLLMRLLSPLVGVVTGTDGDVATAISGIVVSTFAFALALFIIHRETTVTHSRSIADRTVLVLSFLPFALTWQAVYTESLTLLFLAVLWAALRRGLVTTAVLSGVAVGATRSIGIPLGVGLLAVHLAWPLCRHRQVARADFGSAAPGAAALVSSAGVLVWLGRAGGGVGAQAQFGRARSWPWVPVWRDLTGVGGYQLGSITSLLAIAVGATYVFARNEPVEWRIAVGTMLLMHLVMARQFPAYTIGAARYLMPIFPVSVWLAGKSMSLSRPVLIGISVIGLSTALVCAHSAGQGAFNLG